MVVTEVDDDVVNVDGVIADVDAVKTTIITKISVH